MKTLKILMCLLLCCVLALPCFNLSMDAAAEENNYAEVVLLLDVSGSINTADKFNDAGSNYTFDAVELFGLNKVDQGDLHIKLIPYGNVVYEGFDMVNVNKDTGKYKEYVNRILTDPNNTRNADKTEDTVPGLECFSVSTANKVGTTTNIGAAIESAYKTLENSKAQKKVIVLFTDGKIELIGDDAIQESKDKADEFSKKIHGKDISFYSLGLNADGNVDKAFLNSLYGDATSEEKEQYIHIIDNSLEMSNAFNTIFADIFGRMLDPEPDDFPIDILVPAERTIKIYENAVKMAIIDFSSEGPIKTIKVVTPNGVEVVNVDLDDLENGKIMKEYCTFNCTTSKTSVKIELINFPEGGDWKIYATGEKGTVIENKVYEVAVKAEDSLKDGGTYYVGDKLSYKVSLHSIQNGQQLTAKELFDGALGAGGNFAITPVEGGSPITGNAVLDESGVAYNCEATFIKPGEYIVKTELHHNQYDAATEKKITVVGPKVAFAPQADYVDGTYNISFKATHPVSGADLSSFPAYLNGTVCKLSVSTPSGKTVELGEIEIDKLIASKTEYTPAEEGEHSFHASIVSNAAAMEEIVITVDAIKASLKFRVIEVLKPLEAIKDEGLSAGFEHSFALNEYFKDADGKPLKYEVSVEGDSAIAATIEGDKLVVKANDFGKANVVINIKNEAGAEKTVSFEVSAVSTMGTLITIICIIAGVIVLAVVAILFVNSKKKVSFAFKMKVTKTNSETYDSTEVVYSVQRISSRKGAKGTMTVAAIINARSLANVASSTMSEADINEFVNKYAGCVEITGVPFKKQFKIAVKSADKKKVVQRAVFNNTVATVKAGGDYSVSFGNNSAFLQQY